MNRFFRTLITCFAFVSLLSACNLPSAVTNTPVTSTPAIIEETPDPQVSALRQLEADSETPPELYFQNGFPRFVSGSFLVEGADVVERARNFLQSNQDLYRIANPDLNLAVRRVSEAEAETDVVFYQTYKDIEIFASEIVVTLSGDRVNATVGGLLNGDLAVAVTPLLSESQAEESAITDLAMPNASAAGTTTLMIFDPSLLSDAPPEPHLVWRVTLNGSVPWQVFVDAQTGLVVFKYSLAQGDYDYEEFNAGGGGYGDCYFLSGDSIGDEDGLETSWHSDPEAANVWWFARNAYIFYRDTFGRHSYDNDDSQLEVFIRADAGGSGASWIYFCNLIVVESGWVGQDVVMHELTHGVIASTSDLVYSNQSGALNESYADVMASLQDGNWTNAEDRIGGGGAIRDLSNPPNFGQPDRMPIFMTTRDNGGVHTNSGIHNKVAYLIAVGEAFNGWTITGIGNGKMGSLFYATMTSLGSSAQFIDARNATVARADRWASTGTIGFTPLDACQVQNAYAAVGLGDGDTDCDGTDNATDPDNDGDYIPDSLDNCPLVVNPGQQDDTDSDGQGNACDNDLDNDTVLNVADNCPLFGNTDQADANADGIGDACTTDDDNDGVLDVRDNCPSIANHDQGNQDGDGLGNACDTDDDNDGLHDDPRFGETDNCPLRSNADQADTDGDGVGNACDNSRLVANPDQADTDGDRIGDASDNCPGVSNPNQADADRDGLGDRCDGSDEFSLIPDGSLVNLSIHGEPGQLRTFPIPVCKADNCPKWFPPDYLVSIVLTGLSPNVAVWVTDDTGKSVDQSSYKGNMRVLRFHPNGGRIYHLSFLFSLDSPEGQVGYMGSMSAGPADKQPNPTPDGPISTPFSPPPSPAIGFVTPTIAPLFTETPQAPSSVMLTFISNAFCRKGPGSLYRNVSSFVKGKTTQADGRNAVDPRWFWVQVPNSTEHCWVSYITVEPNDLSEGLPIQPVTFELPIAPASFVVSKRICSPNGFSLQLAWTISAGADGYTLYRDGQKIATFKANQTQYQENPPLDKSLHYELEAFNENGFSERLVIEDRCP
ncbi:MAG: thrombospondin type 3 repeat-containing protein [Chloroflexi bacterium]|nr:thrombospondin type 3 repeat-containing protein [Chloroflexota bacterium]